MRSEYEDGFKEGFEDGSRKQSETINALVVENAKLRKQVSDMRTRRDRASTDLSIIKDDRDKFRALADRHMQRIQDMEG